MVKRRQAQHLQVQYITVMSIYIIHTCYVHVQCTVLYCLYMCTLCGYSVKNDFLGGFMKVNPLNFPAIMVCCECEDIMNYMTYIMLTLFIEFIIPSLL